MNKENLGSIEEKINLIRKLDNESCKYLVSIFHTYVKVLNQNTDDFFAERNIVLSESKQEKEILNKIISVNDNITLICFDNDNSEERVKYYSDISNKYKNINIVLVSNKVSISKIKKEILKKKCSTVLISINIQSIDIGKDWEYILLNNFENILNNFNKAEKTDIENNPEAIAYDSILCEKYKENKSNKINLIKAEQLINIVSKLIKVCLKNNIEFGKFIEDTQIVGYINNIDDFNYINKIKIREIATAIKTSLIVDKKEKIEYVYDKLCERIDEDLVVYKYCNFNNNKCIAQRDDQNKNNYPVNDCNGCCYNVEKKVECDKLKNKECTTECISCRLFICKYLKDRGISYEVRDNLQIRTFLNIMQKPILVWNFFKTREEVIKELMKW